MKKNDLANYIGEELKLLHPFFQWKVVTDTKKQVVEVYCTFRYLVDDKVQVQDILGRNNDTGYIQFEDVICFYDPAISHLQPGNYLMAVPFDNHVGIDKGKVDACIKQLNIVLSQGSADIKEFIDDVTQGEFELKWNDVNFDQAIATLKETNRYSAEKLFMVLDEENSLIDQFTKDGEYDGVERV